MGNCLSCLAAGKPLPSKDRQCRHLSAQATTAAVMVILLGLGLVLVGLVLGLRPRT
jgi:hypothetical protein